MLSTAELLDALRRFSLLDAEKLDELQRKLQGRLLEARAVAHKLVEKGWLTAYQVERLLAGRGNELVLGPYVVIDCLGKGGMGEVVKARHRILGRIDALKTIRSDSLQSEALVQRFLREALAAAHLRHPNVVQVYGADKAGEVHYLAMEYVAGPDLAALVDQQGPLSVASACEYVRQAALGLQHIHDAGLVHRDIKPSNLLLQPAAPGSIGVVKVLDLGLARFEAGAASDGTGRLTASGAVIGTPDFVAPEQTVDAHSVDSRADLYSLGCTLYFLLTGAVPFPGGMLIHKVVAHQMHEPEAVETLRPDTPREVAAIVRKLMAKKPENRFQTAAELVEALTRLAEPPQPPPPTVQQPAPRPGSERTRPQRRSLWPGLLVVTLLLALAVGGSLVVVLVGEQLPKRLAIDLGGGVKLEMVRIDPGEFWMGSQDQEIEAVLRQFKDLKREWLESELPRHKVKITRPFYLGKYEVTQEQYQRVTGKKNPSWFSATAGGKRMVEGMDTRLFPVESVSWEEANAFCEELTNQVGDKPPVAELRRRGYKFHLPTEAQWEYACRAGTEMPYHFGTSLNGDKANCDGTVPFGTAEKGNYLQRTCKVGEYAPNDWGLFDMHGNVWEWCQDCWEEKFYSSSHIKDPVNLKSDTDDRRVLRGGSWHFHAAHCRAASRNKGGASDRDYGAGLRAALRLD
jgi:serine/threonine-protein kinase